MRRLHACVGWAAIALGVVHVFAVEVAWAHNRESAAWFAGRLLLGLAVIAPGVWMVRAAARNRALVSSAGALALVSLAELAVFHAAFPAVFSVAAVVDGVAASLAPSRRAGAWLRAAAFLALVAAAFWAGGLLAPEVRIEP